jgi:hypothetical protein
MCLRGDSVVVVVAVVVVAAVVVVLVSCLLLAVKMQPGACVDDDIHANNNDQTIRLGSLKPIYLGGLVPPAQGERNAEIRYR